MCATLQPASSPPELSGIGICDGTAAALPPVPGHRDRRHRGRDGATRSGIRRRRCVGGLGSADLAAGSAVTASSAWPSPRNRSGLCLRRPCHPSRPSARRRRPAAPCPPRPCCCRRSRPRAGSTCRRSACTSRGSRGSARRPTACRCAVHLIDDDDVARALRRAARARREHHQVAVHGRRGLHHAAVGRRHACRTTRRHCRAAARRRPT